MRRQETVYKNQRQKNNSDDPKNRFRVFLLVIRYISPEFTAEQVAKEVKRSAIAAGNFYTIIYRYHPSTNDFRFIVSDLKEYNGLFRLGHIGISNNMRIDQLTNSSITQSASS
jgi:hypothetical protein